MGRKIEVQETTIRKKILILPSNFCALREIGAHGTCHACHTVDTPLLAKMADHFTRTDANNDTQCKYMTPTCQIAFRSVQVKNFAKGQWCNECVCIRDKMHRFWCRSTPDELVSLLHPCQRCDGLLKKQAKFSWKSVNCCKNGLICEHFS